jgi:hypothetical protein
MTARNVWEIQRSKVKQGEKLSAFVKLDRAKHVDLQLLQEVPA